MYLLCSICYAYYDTINYKVSGSLITFNETKKILFIKFYNELQYYKDILKKSTFISFKKRRIKYFLRYTFFKMRIKNRTRRFLYKRKNLDTYKRKKFKYKRRKRLYKKFRKSILNYC